LRVHVYNPGADRYTTIYVPRPRVERLMAHAQAYPALTALVRLAALRTPTPSRGRRWGPAVLATADKLAEGYAAARAAHAAANNSFWASAETPEPSPSP
jgi:hypothetical protein